MCETASSSCIECTNDDACTDPKRPACSVDQQCVQCTRDDHCSAPGKPACILATQRCGECSRDEHCSAAARCDLAAARCVAIASPAPAPDAGPVAPPGMDGMMMPPPPAP
jgi:hypothetical protein